MRGPRFQAKVNSVPPAGKGLMLSVTPTIPSPPSSSHFATARESASRRTPYSFRSSALNGPPAAEARSVRPVYDQEPEHLLATLTKPR